MNANLKNAIKDWMPYGLRLKYDAKRQQQLGGHKECPVCGQKVCSFVPYDMSLLRNWDVHQVPLSLALMETFNLLAYSCPWCKCSDRNRLYALYLKKVFETCQNGQTTLAMLDIAPSPMLTSFIKKHACVKYRSADLYSAYADDKVDVMEMGIYSDEAFDFVICSHVFEHVRDDRKAMREVYRVMKKNAKAILMVPIYLGTKDIDEDPSITDEHVRWQRFAQNDHVRLYSKAGFVQRLEEAGFKVSQLDVRYFGDEVYARNGIHPRSVLYVAEK